MANIENTVKKTSLDWLWWSLAFLLIVLGVFLNYHYQMVDISFRLIGWIILVIAVLALLYLSSQGKRVLNFAKESRIELSKVVWPNRQETIQTTLLVIGLVIILALIIWGLDSILYWLVGLLTNQRG